MSYEISGNVYILTNPSMPGLIKIGFTDDDTVDYRITDLWTTGVPEPFKLEAYSKNNTARELEKQIHKLLDKYRLNKEREFFKISVETALETIQENIRDIEWNIGESYELIKKEYWVVSYKKTLNKLINDIDKFEKYAEEKNWCANTNDKWYSDNFMNKHNFDCYIKNKVKYLKDGIEKRPQVINEKCEYLKDDDKYAKKELRDVLKQFQDFKYNI